MRRWWRRVDGGRELVWRRLGLPLHRKWKWKWKWMSWEWWLFNNAHGRRRGDQWDLMAKRVVERDRIDRLVQCCGAVSEPIMVGMRRPFR